MIRRPPRSTPPDTLFSRTDALPIYRGAAEHGAIRTTLEAGARGYKTIFTLKWPQNDRDFPKAGSAAFAREIARLDAVLPLVMGKVDILVIGKDRKSVVSGKSVSVRVDLGGRRSIKKKKK